MMTFFSSLRGSISRTSLSALLRWGGALLTAILLSNLDLIEAKLFPLAELPKGSVARYTMRASCDGVFDLHETFKAEAEEARQTYMPIYNRDEYLPYDRQDKILAAALNEPLTAFAFPPIEESEEESTDAGQTEKDVTNEHETPKAPVAASDAGLTSDLGDAHVVKTVHDERLEEIEAIVRTCFRLLEPYYKDGVIGDNEFPREKRTVRVFYRNEYNMQAVADLHRFSSLRPDLAEKLSQIAIKSEPRVRERIIDYILERLPPNLTYAKENALFIGDISQVTGMKVVLIRAGEILVKRGQVVDTRAFHAIRASVAAAAQTSGIGKSASKLGLLLALMLLFVVAAVEFCKSAFRSFRSILMVLVGILLLALTSDLILLFFPLHTAVIPQASLALIAAVVLGRAPGLLLAITVPACLILTQVFDLSTLLVGISGGVTAAFSVRRRRRGSALAASVLIGLVQALIFEACRVLEGRARTYAELWSGAEAFIGGLLSGALAMIALPFVEALLGRSSRGTLRMLCDFDHPLLRELRERAPGTFSHSVTLMNIVENAVDAASGDRLLARTGALYHDVGKLVSPQVFLENRTGGLTLGVPSSGEELGKGIIEHVSAGLIIARRHHLPPDVTAFIAEHHGTGALELGPLTLPEGGRAHLHYPGPKPQTVEAAVLMIADAVEMAVRTHPPLLVDALAELIDRIIFTRLTEYQFDECGINQADLQAVKGAILAYFSQTLHQKSDYLAAT